jgi:hypothetical protein
MRIPRLPKKSSVSLEMGAAEVTLNRLRSRPSFARTLLNTSLSARP